MRNATHNAVRLQDLTRLLGRIGFRRQVVPGSHQVLAHEASRVDILLPLSIPSARGIPTYVAAVRKALDESGLMERGEFDRWLGRRTSATNGAGTGARNGARTRRSPVKATTLPGRRG